MKFIISIYSLFFVTICLAQENISFNLVAQKNKIELGEPITVRLSIDFPAEFSNQKIVLPLITDSSKLGEGIEIWAIFPVIDTLKEQNNGSFYKHIEQEFTVATFDTGMVDINPLVAIFNSDTVVSNAITLTVLNEPLEKNATLKDIKPIEEDPYTNWEKFMLWLKEYWIILTIVILLPIAALVVYIIIKNRPEKVEVKEIIPLNVRVLSELDKIEKEKTWQKGEYKKYYSDITAVLWEYLSERYQIATYEKTSGEIIEQLKHKAVSRDQFIQLQKLMELADLVKFAKTIPTPLENESILSITRDFIQTTYESENKPVEE